MCVCVCVCTRARVLACMRVFVRACGCAAGGRVCAHECGCEYVSMRV